MKDLPHALATGDPCGGTGAMADCIAIEISPLANVSAANEELSESTRSYQNQSKTSLPHSGKSRSDQL